MTKSCSFLIAPSAFLYIQNVFYSENKLARTDWVHFVPFGLTLILLSNIALQNPDSVSLLSISDTGKNQFETVKQANIYYGLIILKYVLWFFYCIFQSMSIINFERKKEPSFNYNYRLINWVKIFNITLIVLFLLLASQRLFQIKFTSIDFLNDITVSITLITTIGLLVSRPHILYSLESPKLDFQEAKKVDTINISKPKIDTKVAVTNKSKTLFDTKKQAEYMAILNQVLEHDKPYLNKGITVKDLSELTNIPPHHLSYLINVEFNLHFQDFINLNRIEYLKSKINDIEWEQLTLEGICWDIGFASRTTFFRAFVKLTGVPPSEYFRGIKKNNTA
ncbi:helix-turn-helix domain-containing protein [Pedobacter sp. MW01-1-1]|uniref:helix-turn-helix domain-containing protein n=1 Tax=Pedobacter sp. MW01-1-1 TaxID=3383027 RepID=UPI003FEF68CD